VIGRAQRWPGSGLRPRHLSGALGDEVAARMAGGPCCIGCDVDGRVLQPSPCLCQLAAAHWRLLPRKNTPHRWDARACMLRARSPARRPDALRGSALTPNLHGTNDDVVPDNANGVVCRPPSGAGRMAGCRTRRCVRRQPSDRATHVRRLVHPRGASRHGRHRPRPSTPPVTDVAIAGRAGCAEFCLPAVSICGRLVRGEVEGRARGLPANEGAMT
jgi:hypothetical protein